MLKLNSLIEPLLNIDKLKNTGTLNYLSSVHSGWDINAMFADKENNGLHLCVNDRNIVNIDMFNKWLNENPNMILEIENVKKRVVSDETRKKIKNAKTRTRDEILDVYNRRKSGEKIKSVADSLNVSRSIVTGIVKKAEKILSWERMTLLTWEIPFNRRLVHPELVKRKFVGGMLDGVERHLYINYVRVFVDQSESVDCWSYNSGTYNSVYVLKNDVFVLQE